MFGTDLDLPSIRAQLSPLVFSSFFIPGGGCHTSPPTKYPCQEYYTRRVTSISLAPLACPPIDRNDIIAIITLDFFYYHCRGPESRGGNKRRSLALLKSVSLEPGPKFLFALPLPSLSFSLLRSASFSTSKRKERGGGGGIFLPREIG